MYICNALLTGCSLRTPVNVEPLALLLQRNYIKSTNMQEIWKDIPDYKGIYQASEFGNIKSLKFGKERILKLYTNKKGYRNITFTIDNKRKTIQVQILVAMAFLNHIPDGHNIVVDHKDNDPSNNNVVNLQLISQRKNCSKDKFRLDCSSKYVGVCLHKPSGKWMACIRINNKNNHIGLYVKEFDAHKAYQQKIKAIALKKNVNLK